MKEPRRNKDVNSLVDYVAVRVESILEAMKKRGYDPIVFEARRSEERQDWLWGIGRTHSKRRKPVTWTKHSRHIVGKAADIISRSRLWDWPEFYDALKEEAEHEGLHVLTVERCHVEWR